MTKLGTAVCVLMPQNNSVQNSFFSTHHYWNITIVSSIISKMHSFNLFRNAASMQKEAPSHKRIKMENYNLSLLIRIQVTFWTVTKISFFYKPFFCYWKSLRNGNGPKIIQIGRKLLLKNELKEPKKDWPNRTVKSLTLKET